MSRPRTRADLESRRAQGSLVGYFVKLPRGWPPKRAKLVDNGRFDYGSCRGRNDGKRSKAEAGEEAP